jgi:DNA helicase II / ATP-dependent DNA helicase PcrA
MTRPTPPPIFTPRELQRQMNARPPSAVEQAQLKRKYSVTGDILSFKRCKRQYGFFARRQYAAAQEGQLFFGTVIHETLDRAHAHFQGLMPGTKKGDMPKPDDIATYFAEAERALRLRGIRPMSVESREAALGYVQNFNNVHGPTAYPRIVDTEHRLQKDTGAYLLTGVVDVVAEQPRPAGHEGEWSEYEIWDYKGSKIPPDAHVLQDYEFQMRVYAHLYEQRNGIRPKRAVLWFLGEQPTSQRHEVDLDPAEVKHAVDDFQQTVDAIERSIASNDWSDLSQQVSPPAETCDACDLRWNCKGAKKTYQPRKL